MGLEQLIDETIQAVEKLKEKVKRESIDWWWLSQGDDPVISVKKVILKENKVDYHLMPKLSLKAAINIILENLEKAKEADVKFRTEIFNVSTEDLDKIVELYETIREAHEIIKQIEKQIPLIDAIDDEEKRTKLKKIAKGTISWIKEIIQTDPQKWGEKKQTFQNVANKLAKDVSTL